MLYINLIKFILRVLVRHKLNFFSPLTTLMGFQQSEWINFLSVARLSLRTSVLRNGNNKHPEYFPKPENAVSDKLTRA